MTIVAIPVLLTNPAVLSYLLEFAALSIKGVTPTEFFNAEISSGAPDVVSTFFGALGEFGRLLADGLEWVVMEKPAL